MWLIWNIVFWLFWNKNWSYLILQPNSVSDPTFQDEGPSTDLMSPENEFCSAGKSEFCRLYPKRDIVGYWTILKDIGWSPCMDSFWIDPGLTSYWVKRNSHPEISLTIQKQQAKYITFLFKKILKYSKGNFAALFHHSRIKDLRGLHNIMTQFYYQILVTFM